MALANKEYWIDRSVKDSERVWQEVDVFSKNLKSVYQTALDDTQQVVDVLYSRYAEKGGINAFELRRELSQVERKGLYKRIDELYKTYKVNPSDGILFEIEKLSLKTRIDRLDDVMLTISSRLSDSNSLVVNSTRDFLTEQYSEAFNHNVFNVFQGLGEGRAFNQVNENLVKQAINFQWSGDNFSGRLWDNKNKLVTVIRDTVTQGAAQGKSIQQMTKDLAGKLESNYSNARRIVRTETAYVIEDATKEAYKELEIERYEYIATLDNRTSEICAELDGKEFKVLEAVVGVNYPPLHPNCRSTTAPVVNSKYAAEFSRKARDSEDKSYQVPANLKYKDWKKEYIEAA